MMVTTTTIARDTNRSDNGNDRKLSDGDVDDGDADDNGRRWWPMTATMMIGMILATTMAMATMVNNGPEESNIVDDGHNGDGRQWLRRRHGVIVVKYELEV
jgi:hypothetical protein